MGFDQKRTKTAANDIWLQVDDVGSAGNPALRVEARSEGRVLAWVEVEGSRGDVYLTFSAVPAPDMQKTVVSQEIQGDLSMAASVYQQIADGIRLLEANWKEQVSAYVRDNRDDFPDGNPFFYESLPRSP
jgi:hypothetical protein